MKSLRNVKESFGIFVITIFLTTTANATLEFRLGGKAVYDSNHNITWLADPSAASPNAFDNGISNNDGFVTHGNAVSWLENLNVYGVTGWEATEESGRWYNPDFVSTEVDFLIDELVQAPSEFFNVFGSSYWAVGALLVCGGSPCPGHPDDDQGLGIIFHVAAPNGLRTSASGYDTAGLRLPEDENRILAMHDGDVFAQIPEPGIIALLSVGLIGLIIQRRNA